MKGWRRGFVIIFGLAPFLIAFLRDRRRWLLFGARRPLPYQQHVERADRLTATIARLGPTFIKLAQVFSARADILPEPYLSAISRLQDQVPPEGPETIERVIVEELNRPVDELFEEFERTPVAAASLGQVHRARVDGETVAVKVLRPGVEDLVATDLDISFRVLFLLNILFPNHHVRAVTNVVREFSVRVKQEMDFRQEAEHIALFRSRFADDPQVGAPSVLGQFTSRRVIVMEWIDGDKVDRLGDRFAAGDLNFETFMRKLVQIYLRMLLLDGFLHADPHPGNILVQKDGRIIFLDWGMVVQLSRTTRDAILRLALAAAREDLNGMVNAMYELGMIDPDISRAEIRDAAAEIISIVNRVRELGLHQVQQMVTDIMDTFYTWPLMLPRELVYFLRAAALLEGIGFRYDPVFNALETTKPVIDEMRGELLRANMPEPAQVARNTVEEIRAGFTAIREIVVRAEREEFRVRLHPRDIQQSERFFLLQVRRILLSIFALTIAVITSITFIAAGNYWILGTGLLVSFVMFVVVFLLPSHLLENPLRHARGIRPTNSDIV